MCARVFELHVRISAKADCMGFVCVCELALERIHGFSSKCIKPGAHERETAEQKCPVRLLTQLFPPVCA